jgi:hypothetical protein
MAFSVMNKLFLLIGCLLSSWTIFAQEKQTTAPPDNLLGVWQIVSQRLDNLEVILTECEQHSTFTFTPTEIIENYYKMYNGNCVILNTNKENYTVKGNHIFRKEETDLNNTFLIEGDTLTLSFLGKDEEGTEHIAVIVCKKAKPIEL